MKILIYELEEGVHEYDEEISASNYDFLDKESYSKPLQLNIFIDKISNLFRFKIGIRTKAVYTCDRCLNKFNKDINDTIEQLYQIGQSEFSDDDEIEVLPENTREIDISKAIHDFFIMNRPIKLVCDKQCKGICPKCGENLNMKKCKCSESVIDPRLEKLKLFMK